MNTEDFVGRVRRLEVSFRPEVAAVWNHEYGDILRERILKLSLKDVLDQCLDHPRTSDFMGLLLDAVVAEKPPLHRIRRSRNGHYLPTQLMELVRGYYNDQLPGGMNPDNIPKVFFTLKILEDIAIKGARDVIEDGKGEAERTEWIINARIAVKQLSRPIVRWDDFEFERFPDAVRTIAFYLMENIRDRTTGTIRDLANEYIAKSSLHITSQALSQKAHIETILMGNEGIGPAHVYLSCLRGLPPSTLEMRLTFQREDITRAQICAAVGSLLASRHAELPSDEFVVDGTGGISPYFKENDVRLLAFRVLALEAGGPEVGGEPLAHMIRFIIGLEPFEGAYHVEAARPLLTEMFGEACCRCGLNGQKLAQLMLSPDPADICELTGPELQAMGGFLFGVIAQKEEPIIGRKPRGDIARLMLGRNMISALWAQSEAGVKELGRDPTIPRRLMWVESMLTQLGGNVHPALRPAMSHLPSGTEIARLSIKRQAINLFLPPSQQPDLNRALGTGIIGGVSTGLMRRALACPNPVVPSTKELMITSEKTGARLLRFRKP